MFLQILPDNSNNGRHGMTKVWSSNLKNLYENEENIRGSSNYESGYILK